MKRFLLILFVLLSYISGAQTTNSVYPWAFLVDNDVIGGKIQVYNESVSISGTISFNVNQSVWSNFLDLATNFAIVDGQAVLYSQDGPTINKSTDFYNGSYLSNAKYYSINIPSSVVSSVFSSHPNAKWIVRYKYRIVGNPAWLPQGSQGIGEYYRGGNEYGFKDERPRATITGLDEIETEGTYSVGNAISVALYFEDEMFPSATLTDLGSGNYKIARIGAFVGNVFLIAVSQNNLETVKKIKITGPAPTITGPSSICTEEIYTIENATNIVLENASGIATLTNLGGGQWKVSKIGNAAGKVTLKAVNSGMVSVEKNILIGIKFTNSINGNPTLPMGEYRDYTITLEEGVNDINWSVTYYPNVILTKLSNNKVRLSTTGSAPFGATANLTLTARAVGECGLSNNYITKTISFVNDRDPRIE